MPFSIRSLRAIRRPRIIAVTAAAVVLLVLVSACSSDSSGPVTPASVAPAAGVLADGTVATVLDPAATFTVKDADGNTLGGVAVTVMVTAGGGTLAGAPTTTRSGGPTPVGQWTLGTVAGVNSITVTVAGLPPLVITVNGRAGPPASIVFVSGQDQSVPAGTIVSPSPTAQVRDQFNNGVEGVLVTFVVTEGDGTLAASTATTNSTGNAPVPEWRVGKSATSQTVRASVSSLSTTVRAFINTDYAIELRFFGPDMPPAAASAFNAAAARISGAVTGDVVDVVVGGTGADLGQCGVAGEIFSGVIDDVVIYATVTPIDGPGKVLGSAGPCFVRTTGRQTVIGVMRFDSDDIQGLITNGALRDVIQHEMLHVIGIGTLWNAYSIIQGVGSTDPRYTGAQGVAACVAVGGAAVCPASVPAENEGGPGSVDSHWRESVFAAELMTSRLSLGGNPFSSMSIQSLADVGYVVNSNAADPYTVPGQAVRGPRIMGSEATVWETLEKPKFTITTTGRLTPVERQ